MTTRLLALLNRYSPLVQSAAVVLSVLALQPLLSLYSRYFWYLPTGMRFAALLLLPRRLWPALIASEFFLRAIKALSFDPTVLTFVLSTFAPPLAGVVAVAVLFRANRSVAPASPAGMGRLIAAMLVSATLESLSMTATILSATGDAASQMSLQLLGLFLGDYSGLLVIVPALLAGLSWSGIWRPSRRLVLDVIFVLLLPFAAFSYLHALSETELVRDFSRILIAAPAVYFAFRHGWRGAAVASTVMGFTLAPLHIPLGVVPDASVSPQLLFVLIGTSALLLGAALDDQHAARRALKRQNTELANTNAELQTLGSELRDATLRKVRLEEAQRQRLAIEIHDELGQNLTAVHTHLKLEWDRLAGAQMGDMAQSMLHILTAMRGSVKGLMNTLRPPVLDELGLQRALDTGPLREMVQRAGMEYRFVLRGEASLVDVLTHELQLAIWRIVQESANNAVRHSQAKRFDVRLRIAIRGVCVWVVIIARDDGIGIEISRSTHRGDGLQGMRDRILAYSGVFKLDSTPGATRVRALLRQGI